jgi:hypothetical protein
MRGPLLTGLHATIAFLQPSAYSLGRLVWWLVRVGVPTFGIVVLSWTVARARGGTTQRHVRWYVVAAKSIPTGTWMTPDLLRETLGNVPDSTKAPTLVSLGRIVGRYAVRDLLPDDAIDATAIIDDAPLHLPPNGAIVPVRVRTEYARVLTPGQRLTFVRDTVAIYQIPAWKSPPARHGAGLTLLTAKIGVAKDSASVLLVAVPHCLIDAAWLLAKGEWRPVIVAPAGTPDAADDVSTVVATH